MACQEHPSERPPLAPPIALSDDETERAESRASVARRSARGVGLDVFPYDIRCSAPHDRKRRNKSAVLWASYPHVPLEQPTPARSITPFMMDQLSSAPTSAITSEFSTPATGVVNNLDDLFTTTSIEDSGPVIVAGRVEHLLQENKREDDQYEEGDDEESVIELWKPVSEGVGAFSNGNTRLPDGLEVSNNAIIRTDSELSGIGDGSAVELTKGIEHVAVTYEDWMGSEESLEQTLIFLLTSSDLARLEKLVSYSYLEAEESYAKPRLKMTDKQVRKY